MDYCPEMNSQNQETFNWTDRIEKIVRNANGQTISFEKLKREVNAFRWHAIDYRSSWIDYSTISSSKTRFR